MWKLLFLILATAAASDSEENTECKYRLSEECDKAYERPEGFPGTEEEQKEFCKFALKYSECVSRVINECNAEETDLTHYREMSSAAIRICDEDSLLYSDITDSLSCLKKNQDLFTTPCSRILNKEAFRTFSETLQSNGVTDDAIPESCLTILYDVGCYASIVGKMCGDRAREVILDVVQGFDSPFEKCHPGMKENLRQIAKVMQMKAEEEEAMQGYEIQNSLR